MISPLMYEFLLSWYTWANGTPNDLVKYSRSSGLCSSIHQYSLHGIIYEDKNGVSEELHTELRELLRADGLCPVWPFGEEAFLTRLRNKSQHQDPQRLAWVKSTLDKYESQQ